MSANLVKIDPGATNWNKGIDSNFEALNANSGWVQVPLTNVVSNGLGSYLALRKTANQVDIKAQFVVGTVGDVKIGTIPANMLASDWRFLQGFVSGQSVISITIDNAYQVVAHVPEGSNNRTIDVDTTIADVALGIH